MDLLLMLVALVSTSAAFALGLALLKVLRVERERSDARVEALMELAGGSPAAAPLDAPADRLVPSHFHRIQTAQAPPAPAPHPQKPSRLDELELRSPSSVAGIDEMFATPAASAPWTGRLAAAAVCTVVVVVLGVVLLPRSTRTDGVLAGGAAATAEALPASLELLSLKHEASGASLVITGVVQNPRLAGPVSGITATVSLYGKDGALVGSEQAPLDFTLLQPGDESPFVIRVANAAAVARYRVSFRNSRGAVIGHVDRRGGGPIARHE